MTFSCLRVNLVRPIAQTLGASIIPYAMGRLGHNSVCVRSAVLLAHTTTLICSVAERFIPKDNQYLAYAAIPASLYVAKEFVHPFFYPGVQQVMDNKNFAIFTVVLAAIKYGVDNFGAAADAFIFGGCETKEKKKKDRSSIPTD
jgi:hypothetical protein